MRRTGGSRDNIGKRNLAPSGIVNEENLSMTGEDNEGVEGKNALNNKNSGRVEEIWRQNDKTRIR